MKERRLISIFGDDQPGLVEKVAQSVQQHQGNWLESRLSQLGGKFAGLILAEFDSESLEAAVSALENLSSDQLTVMVNAAQGAAPSLVISIAVTGNDKPGIVHEVSQGIRQLQANVESLSSEVEAAPMSGGSLFKAQLQVSLPEGVAFSDIQQQLEQIANDLIVDLVISE